MLRTRQLIPPLTIHTSSGRTVHAWDFKQKKSLVIAFLDADCAPCKEFLAQLAGRAGDLREKEAVALVVFLAPPPAALIDSLPPEILAGADMPGRSVRAFLGDDAAGSGGFVRGGVFVTDRYGELFAQWQVLGHRFPEIGKIFGCLAQIEIACEECSVTPWPAEP